MKDVFVRSNGTGAVFVHGFASTSVDWAPLMEEIPGTAVDLPGYGFSEPPEDGRYSIGAHCRAVVRVIEQQGEPVHLFGNSLGGLIAIRIAARRPELVKSLALLAPALPHLRVCLKLGSLVPLTTAEPVTGPLLHRVSAERRVRIRYHADFYDLSRATTLEAAITEQERYNRLPHASKAFFGTANGIFRDWLSGSLWPDLERIKAPTLLLWGDHDRLVDPRIAVKASRKLPRSRVTLLPRCGHIPQLECPAETAAAFRTFLSDPP